MGDTCEEIPLSLYIYSDGRQSISGEYTHTACPKWLNQREVLTLKYNYSPTVDANIFVSFAGRIKIIRGHRNVALAFE